jgi:prolipoprotein diacylglyceryltransferase
MQQVIWPIPIKTAWFPDGIPIYGFGLMLFIAFILCNWITGRRAARMIRNGIGLGKYVAGPKSGEDFPGGDKPEEKVEAAKALVQDVAIWLFITGLTGARLTYMYHHPTEGGFWAQLVDITNGGIILYGSVIGGLVGYLLFCAYLYSRRQAGLNTLRIADLVAPAVAVGIGLGRVGCLLNGCCYGHVACADCAVSYYAVHFPMSAPPRPEMVYKGYQTTAGFTYAELQDAGGVRVGAVDPQSPAGKSGLADDDLITAVNGKSLVVYKLTDRSLAPGGDRVPEPVLAKLAPLQGKTFETADALDAELQNVLTEEEMKVYEGPILHRARFDPPAPKDLLYRALFPDWKRGDKDLTLTVIDKEGEEKKLTFRPLTLGLYPTQAFETISMAFLFLLLLAFFAFRTRDGQVMAVLMMCYAVHRSLNELLRDDVRPIGFEAYSSYILFAAGAALMAWTFTRPRQYVSEWELVKGKS